MKKTFPSYVEPTPSGRYLASVLIDVASIVLLGIGLNYTLAEHVLGPALGHQETVDAYCELATSTGLYVRQDDSLYSISYLYSEYSGEELFDKYQELEDLVWNYYFVTLGQQEHGFIYASFSSSYSKGSPEYLREYGKIIYADIYDIQEGKNENSFYEVPLTEGEKDYTKKPVLKEAISSLIHSEDKPTRLVNKSALFEYYVGSSSEAKTVPGIYETARRDVLNQEAMQEVAKRGSEIAFYMTLPNYIIPPFLFLVLIPLFLKRGKTLGRLAAKISVIGRDGYLAPKWKVLLYGLASFLPFAFFFIPIPVYLVIGLISGWELLEFIILLMHRDYLTLRNICTRTFLADDKRTPTYFKSQDAEQDYLSSNYDEITIAIEESNLARMEAGKLDEAIENASTPLPSTKEE